MSTDLITTDQPAISLIDASSLKVMDEQRKLFDQFISSQLIKDADYGTIPGTHKPSLYKPGAEKLCRLLTLGSRILESGKEGSLDDGHVEYRYRIEVYSLRSGQGIAQCEGIANSREKKFIRKDGSQDLPSVINTVSKMAQKRAFVGAVLLATSASAFFTQDVEDMDIEVSRVGNQDGGDKPTKKQLNRLYAITKDNNWPDDDVKEYMAMEFKKAASQDLTIIEYRQLCDFIEQHPVQRG